MDVNSLSINAPAAVTFVVSVTSADASIPSNLLWSALSKGTDVTPPIVNASVSSVPSISASPLISNDVASTSPATVTTPFDSVIKSASAASPSSNPMILPLIVTASTCSAVNVPRLVTFV